MARILIIQTFVKKYRVPFFIELSRIADEANHNIIVAYSDAVGIEAEKRDEADLPTTIGKKVKARWFGRIMYQPLLKEILKADAIIIHHEAKHLLLYPLTILSFLRLKKLGFWGLGYSAGGERGSVATLLKSWTLTRPNQWFAYTPKTARAIELKGYPSCKITNVNNSVDTKLFRTLLQSIRMDELADFCRSLDIKEGDFNVIFCGGLYKEKRIDYLLELAELLKSKIPRFNLIVLGSGPDLGLVQCAASKNAWIKFVGPLFGRDKAKAFRLSSLFICPGLVGLNIVDAFAAGLPLVTDGSSTHAPEIDYLDQGENGYISECSDDLIEFIVRCERDPKFLGQLSKNATKAAEKLSVENMARRFLGGIENLLSEKRQ